MCVHYLLTSSVDVVYREQIIQKCTTRNVASKSLFMKNLTTIAQRDTAAAQRGTMQQSAAQRGTARHIAAERGTAAAQAAPERRGGRSCPLADLRV